MATLAEKDKETARKKGLFAGAATVGAVAVMAAGAPILGAIALVPAAFLVKDWFSFRAKRGMRF
jgi:hypothetical protein